ncbi:MAG: TIGR03663 family protein, partial [SAR202 cluster bacterium]|nr:TIGR03663 family protein [SAR202 cluster bacterium]
MATKVAKLGSDAMGKALTGFHDWRRSLRSPIAALAEEGLSIRVIEIIGYLVLAGTALGMRLWDLGSRALHHDESLHAYFSWFFYSTGKFEHNPLMHGPFLFEATAGLFRILGGPSDYTSRVLAVIFGTVLVILPYFFRERLGRIGALLISVMLVFSPAMFYYSRFIRNDIIMAV